MKKLVLVLSLISWPLFGQEICSVPTDDKANYHFVVSGEGTTPGQAIEKAEDNNKLAKELKKQVGQLVFSNTSITSAREHKSDNIDAEDGEFYSLVIAGIRKHKTDVKQIGQHYISCVYYVANKNELDKLVKDSRDRLDKLREQKEREFLEKDLAIIDFTLMIEANPGVEIFIGENDGKEKFRRVLTNRQIVHSGISYSLVYCDKKKTCVGTAVTLTEENDKYNIKGYKLDFNRNNYHKQSNGSFCNHIECGPSHLDYYTYWLYFYPSPILE
jgi:hypothetical protein